MVGVKRQEWIQSVCNVIFPKIYEGYFRYNEYIVKATAYRVSNKIPASFNRLI